LTVDANKELTNHFRFFEEINNNPISNPIALEKQMTQNLTCNRFSQFVSVQWLKVIRFLNLLSSHRQFKLKLLCTLSRIESGTLVSSTRTKLRLF
jgi:hypothetical protein